MLVSMLRLLKTGPWGQVTEEIFLFGSSCCSLLGTSRRSTEVASSLRPVLVEGAASTTVEASVEACTTSSVAVEGVTVVALVGTVAVAVPEALHVVVAVGAVKASAALVEARLSAVEAVLVATGLLAIATTEANAAFDVFLLLFLLLFLSVGQCNHGHKGDENETIADKLEVLEPRNIGYSQAS